MVHPCIPGAIVRLSYFAQQTQVLGPLDQYYLGSRDSVYYSSELFCKPATFLGHPFLPDLPRKTSPLFQLEGERRSGARLSNTWMRGMWREEYTRMTAV